MRYREFAGLPTISVMGVDIDGARHLLRFGAR